MHLLVPTTNIELLPHCAVCLQVHGFLVRYLLSCRSVYLYDSFVWQCKKLETNGTRYGIMEEDTVG